MSEKYLFECEGFFLDTCPLCGNDNYQAIERINGEFSTLFKGKPIDIDELAAKVGRQFQSDLSPIAEALATMTGYLSEALTRLQELEFPDISWIYVKVWQENSWIVIKHGKTKRLAERNNEYDDHDYYLNCCAPVYTIALSQYESYLKVIIYNYLIPVVQDIRNRRIIDNIGGDVNSIQLEYKDGFAPNKKEYYRLYINKDSIEFTFLISGIETFFGGVVSPGKPIMYDEWVKVAEAQKGKHDQLNMFDILDDDKE